MGLGQRGYAAGFRQLSHPKHDVGDEFSAVYAIKFLNECRLEEGELMQPDTVVDDAIGSPTMATQSRRKRLSSIFDSRPKRRATPSRMPETESMEPSPRIATS
jgi:hypothetical protein